MVLPPNNENIKRVVRRRAECAAFQEHCMKPAILHHHPPKLSAKDIVPVRSSTVGAEEIQTRIRVARRKTIECQPLLKPALHNAPRSTDSSSIMPHTPSVAISPARLHRLQYQKYYDKEDLSLDTVLQRLQSDTSKQTIPIRSRQSNQSERFARASDGLPLVPSPLVSRPRSHRKAPKRSSPLKKSPLSNVSYSQGMEPFHNANAVD